MCIVLKFIHSFDKYFHLPTTNSFFTSSYLRGGCEGVAWGLAGGSEGPNPWNPLGTLTEPPGNPLDSQSEWICWSIGWLVDWSICWLVNMQIGCRLDEYANLLEKNGFFCCLCDSSCGVQSKPCNIECVEFGWGSWWNKTTHALEIRKNCTFYLLINRSWNRQFDFISQIK